MKPALALTFSAFVLVGCNGGGSRTFGGEGEPPGPLKLATTLAVSEVALFQAVKVPLSQAGKPAATRPAPVIAGRDALVRVYVSPLPGFTAREITAELRWDGKVRTAVKTVAVASTDGALDSTFNFDVAAADLTATSTYSVSLIDVTADLQGLDVVSGARYPQDGTAASVAAEPGSPIRVTLVPFRYDADGSGRLPDISAAQIERYRKAMFEQYPVSAVEITVHDPESWGQTFSDEFDALNDRLVRVRQNDGPEDDVYYYGLIAPASSFSAFCQGGCVTGVTFLVDDPRDAEIRVGSGIGFSGTDSADTMVHELGHANGREHAPCDVRRADPNFPDADGKIASWGYGLLSKKLVNPETADFMGYCEPAWVSPYTYSALYKRSAALAGLMPKSGMSKYRIGDVEVSLSHAPIVVRDAR
jgi:hypothetical protein